MKRNPIIIFIISISAILLSATLLLDGQSQFVQTPEAKNGTMDLSQWSLASSGPIDLKGEWTFYPYLLLASDEIDKVSSERAIKVTLPMTAESFKKIEPQLSPKLYGTLVLDIRLPDNKRQTYGIHSNLMLTAYRLFVNGQEKMGAGRVSSHEQDFVGEMKVTDDYFHSRSHTARLVYQIADFKIGDTTIIAPIFGTAQQIGNFSKLGIARDLFLFGMLFVIGIYHLGMFAMRPKDKSTLYFALFCIAFALRMLLVGERFLTQLVWIDLVFHMKLCYLLICIGTSGLFGFLTTTFKEQFKPWFFKFILGVNGTMIALVVALPYMKFEMAFNLYLLVILSSVLYAMVALIFAIKQKIEYAGLVLAGIMGIGIAGINDTIFQFTVANRASMIPVGIFIFVMTQAFTLSLKFSKSFARAEALSVENDQMLLTLKEMNQTLEERVMERTRDLQEAVENLNFMSKTDYLTKLPNRLHIFNYIEDLIRQNRKFYVAIADIDEFKLVNDTFGHDIGDKVLIRVSQKLAECLASQGIAGRWGGEEFIMVMRIENEEEAFDFSEFVRKQIESLKHRELDRERRITLTIGLCAFDGQVNIDRCLEFADQALYQGKKSGRNKTVLYDLEENYDVG